MPSMEYKSIVFNAARDGNLRRLKVFLETKTDAEAKNLLSALTAGTPPLVIASRNGHYEVVRYMVERKVDIEQTGCVSFDGERIEGAPSLWCAAAAGHFEIVKFLVENGANVNHTTSTNSTPLRAACFDGHLEIVKYLVDHGADVEIANRHGHTSLMIACYRGHIDVVKYLLSINANVNVKSVKGNTALHDSAESGSTEILKLLLEKGAQMDMDSYGLTPMLAAATLGHSSVVEFLAEYEKCPYGERVNGLQLLGATYIDKKRDIVGAFRYWRRALMLRQRYALTFEPESLTEQAKAAYDGQTEAVGLEQLDNLMNDPDKIRMQALIIRQRILGPSHPDTTYYIRYRGAVYADVGNFERCVQLWLYALNLQQKMMEPLCALTLGSFVSFAELFSFLFNDNTVAGNNNNNNNVVGAAAALPLNNNNVPVVFRGQLLAGTGRTDGGGGKFKFDDMYRVLQIAVYEINRALNEQEDVGAMSERCKHVEKEKDGMRKLCLVVLHLLSLLCRYLENDSVQVDDERKLAFKKSVYELVRSDPKDPQQRSSLLHLACSSDSTMLGRYPVCRFPSLSVVELLIEVGADLYSLDADGNTPLHVALSSKIHRRSVVLALLNRNSPLYVKNNAGKTPSELIKTGGIDIPLMNYVTLKALAAITARRHNLTYRNHVPATLNEYLEQH